MLNRLIESVGFHNAVRINAGMNAGLLIIANLVIRARLPPRPPTKHLWKNLMLDFGYDFSLLGYVYIVPRVPALTILLRFLLLMLGLYFPIFFIQLNAFVNNIDPKLALNIVRISSTFARTFSRC